MINLDSFVQKYIWMCIIKCHHPNCSKYVVRIIPIGSDGQIYHSTPKNKMASLFKLVIHYYDHCRQFCPVYTANFWNYIYIKSIISAEIMIIKKLTCYLAFSGVIMEPLNRNQRLALGFCSAYSDTIPCRNIRYVFFSNTHFTN